jgi:hypothetical protein
MRNAVSGERGLLQPATRERHSDTVTYLFKNLVPEVRHSSVLIDDDIDGILRDSHLQ